MDENKNNEMSVDELLEKLRASLQTEDDENNASSTEKVDDEDIKKVVSAAIGVSDEKADEATLDDEIEEPEEDFFEEDVAFAEEDDMAATIEMSGPSVAEAKEDGAEVAHIHDEDIFAAWGIDKVETVEKEEKTEDAEDVDDVEEYVAPEMKKTKIYYIASIENKDAYRKRKQVDLQKKEEGLQGNMRTYREIRRPWLLRRNKRDFLHPILYL